MKCAVCKREIPEGKDSCECGNRILKCRKCGHDVLPNETRCSKCNTPCARLTNKMAWSITCVSCGLILGNVLLALLLYGKIESRIGMTVEFLIASLSFVYFMVIGLVAWLYLIESNDIAKLEKQRENSDGIRIVLHTSIVKPETQRKINLLWGATILIVFLGIMLLEPLKHWGHIIERGTVPAQVAIKFLDAKDAEVRQSYLAPDVRENLMKRIQQAQKKNPDFLANAPRVEGAKFFDGGEARVKLADSTLQYIELKKIGDQWLITDIEGLPILDYGL